MIAKVITHGKTRDEALNKLHHALAQTEIVGVTTNIGFLTALCRHDDFAQGRVDTGLIERDITALVGPDEPPSWLCFRPLWRRMILLMFPLQGFPNGVLLRRPYP